MATDQQGDGNDITITWKTQVTETHWISLPFAAIAGMLEMTVDEVGAAHAKGHLKDLIDVEQLGFEWEGGTRCECDSSTDFRRLVSVESVAAATTCPGSNG